MIYNTILDALGHTPMIRLNHMTGENDAEIIVKYEGVNIGGSIKTRTAYNMIIEAEKLSLIHILNSIINVLSWLIKFSKHSLSRCIN